jgi:ATP-dependent DNA helicase RecG
MTETSNPACTDCARSIRHSPVQIIRYSNRIEILNPGYSLKDMASLGTPGSRLRNPAIAAVLHELNWAETKGSGIRTMRRLAGEASLPLPEFASDRQKNEFKVTLFPHHLLTEDDYVWGSRRWRAMGSLAKRPRR